MISDKRLEEFARTEDVDGSGDTKTAAIELLARRKFAQDQDAGQVAAAAALTAVWGQGYVAGARAEARACASVYESREAWSKRAEGLGVALRDMIVLAECSVDRLDDDDLTERSDRLERIKKAREVLG